MTRQTRLNSLVLLLIAICSFNSDAVGQQITAEGNVSINGQQAPPELGPVAFVGDILIGTFLDSFASGRLTASEGALLDANFIRIGSEQSTGIFEARGIGTSVATSQGINLFSGSFSVTDGAAVSGFSLGTSNSSPFAPTINISGLGSQLTLGSVFLDRGTLNVSDTGAFSANSLNLGNNSFPANARLNLTDGAQAVVGDLDFGFDVQGRSEVSIGDDSFLSVFSNLTIDGNNTVTLEGGWLVSEQGLNINQFGELRGYGEVIGGIQLEGSPLGSHRLTVTADQTLRTSGISNFTGQITNFGTLDAGSNTIQNAFNGRYLGENSTIRAIELINDGKVNLTKGHNFVEANLDNRGDFNISGGATVIFTNDILNNGVIYTHAGSTSTLLGRLFGSGVFEGEGDVAILGEFAPGNSPGLVSFESDLAFGAGATTEIEIGGTLRSTALPQSIVGHYDAFDVGGTLTLDGELEIALVDGFEIESGQEFVIADVDGSLEGQFNGLDEGAVVGNFGGGELFISYVAGDGNDVSLFTAAAPEVLLGDTNQDGLVDFADIPTFIEILIAGEFLAAADTNQDGAVNFSDIDAFIEILIGN